MPHHLTLQLPKGLDQTAYASEQLDAFASQNMIPVATVAKMQQAMVEWINNCNIYHPKDRSPITLEFVMTQHSLNVDIIDRHAALPDNLFAASATVPDPMDLPEGGWGLFIIQSITDCFHLESTQHGNILHLEVNL